MALRPIRVVISGVDKFSATLGKVSKDMKTIGGSAQSVGNKMTLGLTLPTIAFGGYVLKTAADFELAMNKVKVLTGATADELKELSKIARKLGAETQFSASDAAEAMNFLALAGFEVKEVMTAIPGVLDLAASAQLSMGQSASILSDTLRGYGLAVDQTARVNDVLVKTFTSSNQTLIDLGEAFSYGGNVASQAGLKFEEAAAVLGILANNGMRASVGGTALRGAITSLLAATGPAIEVFEKLGIPKQNVIDSNGKLLSMKKVIGELARTGANTGDVMRIFGERAGPAVLALMKEGVAGIAKFEKELGEAGGTAAKVGAVQMQGLTGSTRELASAFEELRLKIAESGLVQFATRAVKWMTGLLNKMNTLSPGFLRFAVVAAVVVAAIGPIVAIFGTLITAAASFAALWPAIVAAFSVVAPIIGWVVAAGAVIVSLGVMIAKSQTFRNIWGKLLPFFRLAGLVVGKAFSVMWTVTKFVFSGMTSALNVLLKPLELFLDIMTSLATLVLPKWLEKKIGLTADVPAVAQSTASLAASAAGGARDRTEVFVRFDNAPKGTRVESKSPLPGLTTELGMAF